MISLFHGEDTAKSRLLLRAQITQDIAGGAEIRELAGDKLTIAELSSLLATANLFGSESLVIENLFSRLRSKEKDACIQLLVSYASTKNILFWEKKELTKAVLTKLPKHWKISLSKPPAILFNFLDSIYPGNASNALSLFHQLVATADPILAHVMLSRQISYLLIAQSAAHPKFAPWQLGKLKSQADKWSEPALIHFHDELVRIDHQIKSGTTKLDYVSQLDILLLSALR